MAAQVPALFETLSGMQMSELFGRIRSIGDKSPTPTIDGNGGGDDEGEGSRGVGRKGLRFGGAQSF